MIDFIFNMLNLLLRIGLVLYLIKKYIVGYILQAITKEKKDELLLQENHTKLKVSCNDTTRKMEDQKALYNEMLIKFDTWKKDVQSALNAKQQACNIQKKKMELQMEQKQQYLQHRYVIQKELPKLLLQTKQTLHQTFQKDQNLSKSYITKVLLTLPE